MGCITLLSDFGLHDASVAVAKGVLMQHAPGQSIIDISHDVIPFNMRQAAYLLASAYKKFPAGTCHLVLFDIYTSGNPQLVLSVYNDHYFLTANNGVIPNAFADHVGNAHICFELSKEHTFTDWLKAAGNIIQSLQSTPVDKLELQLCELKHIRTSPDTVNNTSIDCEVLHIDHFGNVVINIQEEQFKARSQGRRFRIILMQIEEITEISKNYSDVREGNKLCRFNSNGYLEICINRGKASSLFGFRLNSRHNDIKIIFE